MDRRGMRTPLVWPVLSTELHAVSSAVAGARGPCCCATVVAGEHGAAARARRALDSKKPRTARRTKPK
jgi:hypothetical protein